MAIIDYEQELTVAGGMLASGGSGVGVYGSKPYDLKYDALSPGYGDPAVGEPLHVLAQLVDGDVDNATNGVKFELVNDDDGAGANEISLVNKTVLLAALVEGKTVHVGVVPPGLCTRRYLSPKLTTVAGGSASTTGKISVWLHKGKELPTSLVFA